MGKINFSEVAGDGSQMKTINNNIQDLVATDS